MHDVIVRSIPWEKPGPSDGEGSECKMFARNWMIRNRQQEFSSSTFFRRLPPSCKPSPFSDASLPLTHHSPDRSFPLSVASPNSRVVDPQHSPNDRDSVPDDSNYNRAPSSPDRGPSVSLAGSWFPLVVRVPRFKRHRPPAQVSIDAIKEANGLSRDTIYAGKKLIIP
ncbi:hypothetical protein ACLOJK_008156 [Asimina triloba]